MRAFKTFKQSGIERQVPATSLVVKHVKPLPAMLASHIRVMGSDPILSASNPLPVNAPWKAEGKWPN